MDTQTLTQEQIEAITEYAIGNTHRCKSFTPKQIIEASYQPHFILTEVDSGTAGYDDFVMLTVDEAKEAVATNEDVSLEEVESWDTWTFEDVTDDFIRNRDAALHDLAL